MLSIRAAWVLWALWTAGAGAAEPESSWRCWYNEPVHVTCARPAHLSGPRYLHIPLHNVPLDMARVERLARAVTCHGGRPCDLQFSVRPPVLELDRMMDPLWASVD